MRGFEVEGRALGFTFIRLVAGSIDPPSLDPSRGQILSTSLDNPRAYLLFILVCKWQSTDGAVHNRKLVTRHWVWCVRGLEAQAALLWCPELIL